MYAIVARWVFASRKQRDTPTGSEKHAQVRAKPCATPSQLPDLGLNLSEEELRR